MTDEQFWLDGQEKNAAQNFHDCTGNSPLAAGWMAAAGPPVGLAALACTATFSVAEATVLTELPGVTTSAGSCYTGCGQPHYDHSNIIDGDYGASGNTGLNTWNSGFWGGWVQIDFGAAYLLDRVVLYGMNGYATFIVFRPARTGSPGQPSELGPTT